MPGETSVPGNNVTVLNIAHLIKHVMSSATEAELAALSTPWQENQCISESSWKRWDTSSLQHHYKQKIQWQIQYIMAGFNQKEQKQ